MEFFILQHRHFIRVDGKTACLGCRLPFLGDGEALGNVAGNAVAGYGCRCRAGHLGFVCHHANLHLHIASVTTGRICIHPVHPVGSIAAELNRPGRVSCEFHVDVLSRSIQRNAVGEEFFHGVRNGNLRGRQKLLRIVACPEKGGRSHKCKQ